MRVIKKKLRKKSFILLKNWKILKTSLRPILLEIFQISYSRRTRHSSQGNIMALPLTAQDQGLPTKVDTRLDLLINQKSNATTAMILDTLQMSVKSQSRSRRTRTTWN